MKKRIFAMLCVGLLLVCGVASTESASPNKKFESEKYGVRFTHPSSWLVMTQEAMEALMGVVTPEREDAGFTQEMVDEDLERTPFVAMDMSNFTAPLDVPLYTLDITEAPGATMDDLREMLIGAKTRDFDDQYPGADYTYDIIEPAWEETFGEHETIQLIARIQVGSEVTENYTTFMLHDGYVFEFTYATQREWKDASIAEMDALLESVEFF